MKRLIVPISLVVMALAIAAMLPALVSAETTTESDRANQCYTFSRNFGVTSNGVYVTKLTAVLVSEGLLEHQSGDFDEDVAAAVVKFQAKYGIPTTGYVGPLTRAKLNSLTVNCSTSHSSSSAFVCPDGYICTPANQVKQTCPPGFICTPMGTGNSSNTSSIVNTTGAVGTASTTLCPVGYTCSFNGNVNLPNSTEKGNAAYNFFLTLLRRVPDTQGPGWDYFKNYSGSIDQMRQEFMSGIEYTTKQKIIQMFKEVLNREPNDLELTKWYYVAEYNGYNTDVVLAAIGGKAKSSTIPVVTPIIDSQSTLVCPAGYNCSERAPARSVETLQTNITPEFSLPVAKLSISGQESYTYNVGQTTHYEWDSANADEFSSYSRANDPAKCGEGTWIATTAKGTSDTYISPTWAGCVWTVTFTARNSRTGQSASDSVVATINAVTDSTQSAGTREPGR